MKLDADEVAPGIWQGALPPPGAAVSQAGFNMLVLCAREHQLPSVYFHDVDVVHAPNDDSVAYGPLTREKLKLALQAARRASKVVKAGQRVLVTCAQGMNRSGLVSALTMHLLHGWSGERCIQQVRKRRRSKDGYRPLSNPDFTRALRKLPDRSGA